MKTDKIKARIDDRKARGLTASQYTELIARNLANAQSRVSRACNNCIGLVFKSTPDYDAALDEYSKAQAELVKAQADQESGICSF